jgi:hypothetical protein
MEMIGKKKTTTGKNHNLGIPCIPFFPNYFRFLWRFLKLCFPYKNEFPLCYFIFESPSVLRCVVYLD